MFFVAVSWRCATVWRDVKPTVALPLGWTGHIKRRAGEAVGLSEQGVYRCMLFGSMST